MILFLWTPSVIYTVTSLPAFSSIHNGLSSCIGIQQPGRMTNKCVHKGCGKNFDDFDEECIYHNGNPVFHEGQKGRDQPLPCVQNPKISTID